MANVRVIGKTPEAQGLSLELLASCLQQALEDDPKANDLTVIAVDKDSSYTVNEVSVDGSFLRLFVNYNDPAVHPDS